MGAAHEAHGCAPVVALNPAAATTRASDNSAPAQSRNAALAVLCAGQFLMVLDVSIVNVALPSIQADLAISDSALQYVVSLYALTFGGLLIAGGRAADRHGRRLLFVVGMAIFVGGSVLCGLAPNAVTLFAGRVLLGIGAAAVSPAALALIIALFEEGPARLRALSAWGGVAATGGAAGLLLGGTLTDLLGWQWVFFVDVIPGVAIVVAALRLVPESRAADAPTLDVPGAVLLLGAVGGLIIGLASGQQTGFVEPTALALLGGAVVAAAAFVVVERRSTHPMVDVRIFANPTLTGSNVQAAAISAMIAAQGVFLSLYLQRVVGYTALATGLAVLPLTVVAAATSLRANVVIASIGLRRAMLASLALLGGAFLLFARLPVDSSYVVDLLVPLVLFGGGIGLAFVAFTVGGDLGCRRPQPGPGLRTAQHQSAVGLRTGYRGAVRASDRRHDGLDGRDRRGADRRVQGGVPGSGRHRSGGGRRSLRTCQRSDPTTRSMTMRARPMTIAFDDEAVADLTRRLEQTRWPDQINTPEWDYGTDLGYVRDFVDAWAATDVAAMVTELNRYPHATADVDGHVIHHIHVPAVNGDGIPLLLLHGWPSSFVQMLDIIPLLTDPGAHGGDPAVAFDVVVASLPGYGFSQRPTAPGMSPAAMAPLFHQLMTTVLGYDRYALRGSDLGAAVMQQIARTEADALLGLHVSGTNPFVPPGLPDDLSEAEQQFVANAGQWMMTEMAYAMEHTSKPQTIGYALHDSPAGLAAWMLEKFRRWTDAEDFTAALTQERLITNLTI